ncbi:MAG TPA: alpha/beta fold hydrolase [Gammaproteobacteria bacterium]|nr:alpha/beta fold hydrolase [Gammaproteobacteria bacterium]
MNPGIRRALAAAGCALALAAIDTSVTAQPNAGEDAQSIVTVDHYVVNDSAVPAIAGQKTQVYVRERVKPATVLRGGTPRVVLFVHGAGTPAEVAFDVPYADYSWMAYLAAAGYDVFSMDMTGYGRSTRPAAMNDVCNLNEEEQRELGGAPCKASYGQQLTTVASDWDDIDAVVEHLRKLRGVARVSLVGWSLGGPRSGGYAAQHPDKVDKLVILAPAYNRGAQAQPPSPNPAAGAAFNTQSHAEFVANWDRQVGCPAQYEQATSDAVWGAMLASDPVGATWGQGVRRAPNTTVFGWTQAAVKGMRTPTLMVAGVHDKQVAPERVHEMYEDLGAADKVLVDLACSSHNAMWERNHLLLFRASLEWLDRGTVEGLKQGIVRLGF